MQLMTTNFQQTMTSREIADLVESRHDDVKRSIERLAKSGAISQPPMADGAKAAQAVHLVEAWNRHDPLTDELAAARTLLSDALETFDDNPHQDHEIADRIRAFLKGGAA